MLRDADEDPHTARPGRDLIRLVIMRQRGTSRVGNRSKPSTAKTASWPCQPLAGWDGNVSGQLTTTAVIETIYARENRRRTIWTPNIVLERSASRVIPISQSPLAERQRGF